MVAGDRLLGNAATGGRGRDLYIWFITCFFFMIILSGGIFFVIYNPTGYRRMALIAIHSIYWILTCLYRTVMPYYKPPPMATVAAPADSQVYSLVGERQVRFNATAVIGRKRREERKSSLANKFILNHHPATECRQTYTRPSIVFGLPPGHQLFMDLRLASGHQPSSDFRHTSARQLLPDLHSTIGHRWSSA
ncbi:hypothetical protein MA16_Dca009399 [Dendrobium catenatum]|uniref:Uncharacterized protein n=1 Tax=Dendrobium catenatum TaxID=906689 RepID=A0A2I0XH61_9ASPA|nr:hypothetical protein MA16_Dca009399 [Dendrobium catenatum]